MRSLVYFLLIFSTSAFASKFTIYGMGDSITAGSNVDGLGNFLELSWITGSGLNDSFAQKFSKLGYEVNSVNIAKPGAGISDLPKQLQSIKDPTVDFFGITIGANDVCRTKQDDGNFIKSFINNLNFFLDSIEAKFPGARVILAPVPDVAHVKRLTGDASYCSFVWNISGVCANILQQEDDSILDAYSDLVKRLNLEIVDFLEAKNSEKFMLLNPEMANMFESKHISKTDCFHPSREGQQFISENLWQDWLRHE